MTREEYDLKMNDIDVAKNGYEEAFYLYEIASKEYIYSLEKQNTYKSCDNCKYNNHLVSETDPCNSCMRRMLYMGYCNDSYERR